MDEIEVKIPRKVYDSLKKKAEEKGFTPEELLVLILKNTLQIPDYLELEEEEKEKIRKKLRDLGYI